MRTLYILMIIIVTISLSATSLIVERGNNARVIVPITTIDSFYFANSVAGENVDQLNFVNRGYYFPGHPRQIVVELMDANGNLIIDSIPVTFSFDYDPPDGVSLNQDVYTAGDSLTVVSESGVATVTLYESDEPGTARVRATLQDEGMIVTDWHDYVIDINDIQNMSFWYDVNHVDNMGNGLWMLPVAVLCSTADGTPGAHGTAVWFHVTDPEIDWAIVIAEAYIGNLSFDADSLDGVAHSSLIFGGDHCQEELSISVEVGEMDEEFRILLPICDPQITLLPSPGYLAWMVENNPEYRTADINIILTDGQGFPVQNGIVFLSATLGTFIEPDEQYQVPGEPWSMLQTDSEGMAIARIQFHRTDCPPVDDPPNEINVDIYASLLGANATNQTTIILLNYNEPE